jgi:ornithine cyclodeaminase
MGTSLPNGSELDDATFRRAGRLLVEWKPQSLVEAGEVVQALSAGVLSEADVVDLPQLYRNEAPWRRSAQDIVVFKSVGIGLTDVVAAYSAWQAASGRTGA